MSYIPSMNRIVGYFCAMLLFAAVTAPWVRAEGVRHYVFVGMDREKLLEPGFVDRKGVDGFQVKYTWRQLEQGKDNYVFDDIRADLALVTARGKKLFIQIQDSNFTMEFVPVPKYLQREPEFHGGVVQQVELTDGKPAKPYGHVARRWDPAVRERFHKLLFALGSEFDGRIEGINLPETAIDVPVTGPLVPDGFTPEVYRDGLLETMAALKKAFPKSTVMMYANFMPETGTTGEPILLKSLYKKAAELGVAMGGPDLLPNRKFQLLNSYPLIQEYSSKIPMGIAVQDGNLDDIDPKTGKPVTVQQLMAFATEYLHVTYIFWGTQEPYFTRDVAPFLASR
jgi:hypothetical protein